MLQKCQSLLGWTIHPTVHRILPTLTLQVPYSGDPSAMGKWRCWDNVPFLGLFFLKLNMFSLLHSLILTFIRRHLGLFSWNTGSSNTTQNGTEDLGDEFKKKLQKCKINWPLQSAFFYKIEIRRCCFVNKLLSSLFPKESFMCYFHKFEVLNTTHIHLPL
jgi:hypothetical protein